MSPLWRDELAIYLAPRKLALLRRRGRRVVAATELALAIPPGAGADPAPVLSCLADVLADRTWHRAAARVVVADHPWARCAVVAPPAARLDAAGRLAHARWVLSDAYGDAVAGWDVALSDEPPGRPAVASAIPATLRAGLEEALAPARVALASLQPQLVAAFNAWRRLLPADDAWFVRVDEGALAAIHLSGGGWDRIHLARLGPDWQVELERLQAVARVTSAAGATGRTFVDAPAWMRRAAALRPGIEWLEEGDGARTHVRALLERMAA